jgi:hypothetical protein
MDQEMKAGSDRKAIDTALKRAAKDAVSGSREQRSGRFIPVSQTKGKTASLPQDHKKRQ